MGMYTGMLALKKGSETGETYSMLLGVRRKRVTSASVRLRAGTGSQELPSTPPAAMNDLQLGLVGIPF